MCFLLSTFHEFPPTFSSYKLHEYRWNKTYQSDAWHPACFVMPYYLLPCQTNRFSTCFIAIVEISKGRWATQVAGTRHFHKACQLLNSAMFPSGTALFDGPSEPTELISLAETGWRDSRRKSKILTASPAAGWWLQVHYEVEIVTRVTYF